MRLTQRFKNLLAVPSEHFHPVFAREVATAFRVDRPSAIALEVREHWQSEIEWANGLWPTPVVSYADRLFLPFVAGDSIDEAYRLARAAGVPVFCIDLDVAGTIHREARLEGLDAAFAPRLGSAYFETVEAMLCAEGAPAPGDLAREAHMARRLAELMRDHAKVLWVGGLVHWPRIRRRLESEEFGGPILPLAPKPAAFRRMRLAPSALYRVSGRLPFQVTGYGRRPERHDDATCVQKLAIAATKPELIRAEEIASMLRYARNLAAQEAVRETPDLWNLLTSASTMIGNEYAGRLAKLALEEAVLGGAMKLPVLEYGSSYLAGAEELAGESLRSPSRHVRYRQLPSSSEIEERTLNKVGSDVSTGRVEDKEIWAAVPDEETSYEAFVRHVLDLAGRLQEAETTVAPLVAGLADGIDVRETIRHWHSGEIYVREPVRGNLRITNGLIDYSARSERERVTKPCGGWIDPSCQNVGSASMEWRDRVELQSEPFWVQQNARQVSLVTLDTPTWIRGGTRPSFYDRVIRQLIHLDRLETNLYDWLRIMFGFCREKPFAYCSHYSPGPRISALAREFGVRVVHLPLKRIAKPLRERHQRFRFMHLTERQWDEYLEQLRISRRAWLPQDGA